MCYSLPPRCLRQFASTALVAGGNCHIEYAVCDWHLTKATCWIGLGIRTDRCRAIQAGNHQRWSVGGVPSRNKGETHVVGCHADPFLSSKEQPRVGEIILTGNFFYHAPVNSLMLPLEGNTWALSKMKNIVVGVVLKVRINVQRTPHRNTDYALRAHI